MNRANANKHIWTCLSPQEDMWHLSSWTPSIWDPWEILSTWVFSPPGDLFVPLRRWYSLSLSDVISLSDKLWCDLSLSTFDINFQEGFDPWVTAQSIYKNVMLVEDKIHWVELDQKKHRISGKLFFLLWNRWHRVVCFGCTERIRLDRKQQIGETEFIAEKTLVTSAH